MKYNKGNEWTRLKDNYYVKHRLKTGQFGSIINPEKQEPHMKSTVEEGKSYFDDHVDIQELFDKYAGTGIVERQKDGITRNNKEIVHAIDFEGIVVSLQGTQKTNAFKLHHSKHRTHIVPVKERGES